MSLGRVQTSTPGGVMMMDVIGTQHPLHPHSKSPIQEAEETKMINLVQSRPHHLRIHCPRCYLSTDFTNLPQKATVLDANKRATVGDLLEDLALLGGVVYYYRKMVAPTLFHKLKEENAILKRTQMSTNFEFDKLQRAYTACPAASN